MLAELRRLHAAVPAVARWRHSVAVVDSVGRVRLHGHLRPTVKDAHQLLATSQGQSLVLRHAGAGTPVPVDGRGRLTVPRWLRRLVGPGGVVLVSASLPDLDMVVVTPSPVLDAVVDGLAEGAQR